jgi:hypothetical protein
MRHLKLVLLSVVSLSLPTLTLRADEPSSREQALARENAELRSQLQSLRAEINDLKIKLKSLPEFRFAPPADYKALPDGLRVIPETTRPSPVPAAPAERMPKGTVRQQFNGLPVYIIPLAPDPAPAIGR